MLGGYDMNAASLSDFRVEVAGRGAVPDAMLPVVGGADPRRACRLLPRASVRRPHCDGPELASRITFEVVGAFA